jgi:lysozyme family protein
MAMAAAIVSFEARRDSQGRIAIYQLPPTDGGGTNEVAGINDRFHKEVVDELVLLIQQDRHDEAEQRARVFIAEYTDRAAEWTGVAGVEAYVRDSVFNRGPKGGARIMQRALNVEDDGDVGDITKGAMAVQEGTPAELLKRLRASREQYERDVVGRDESSIFWSGLVNRWNKALALAQTFL